MTDDLTDDDWSAAIDSLESPCCGAPIDYDDVTAFGDTTCRTFVRCTGCGASETVDHECEGYAVFCDRGLSCNQKSVFDER
ncbi:MAG: hypothetical protein ACLFVJ_22620 [Persicimonas sp.]